MRYLITGHTGFKGAWLSLILMSRGHEVSGISIDSDQGSLYEICNLREKLTHDLRVDIRDAEQLHQAIESILPDVVIHLAAQSLVRRSYEQPLLTFDTNVNGTLNLLDSLTRSGGIKACLVITTDKVYKNVGQKHGYIESDPLGGDDPYSASKAMADILCQSWAKSFDGLPIAVARAGNVIGGGDVCQDRLIPDAVRAFKQETPLELRYPTAVRPWQHVMDCLNGYLLLLEAMVTKQTGGEWNFGPGVESFVPVDEVVNIAQKLWPTETHVSHAQGHFLHEAEILSLDSSKAQQALNWQNKLHFPESLNWTFEWELRVKNGENPETVTLEQIQRFGML